MASPHTSRATRLLAEKTALVTGGGRGLGAETAWQLAFHGARVVVNYQANNEAADKVVQGIVEAGGEALALQADVRDRAQVAAMMTRAPKSWQTPDILVLNAAVTPFLPRPLSETELETYEQALTDELRAAFSPVSVLAPRMAQAGRGCILAVSSTLCRMPRAGFSTIAVSEVAISHNFAFRPTGMMREAYVSYLNAIYARNASGVGYQEDVSKLKVNEISNWLRAWMFMEMCGFQAGEIPKRRTGGLCGRDQRRQGHSRYVS